MQSNLKEEENKTLSIDYLTIPWFLSLRDALRCLSIFPVRS